MQACRISIAEAHPSQVVKALLDTRSQFGAFLLADSSCILLSLSSPESQHRLSIPPPCTDVCFLRVQARQLGGLIPLPGSPSSSSSSKGSLGTGRVPVAGPREQANAKGKFAGVSGVALDVEEAGVNVKTGPGKQAGGERQEKQLGQIRMGGNSKWGVAPRTRGSRYRVGDAGTTRGDLFILSAMPGKGGSCTYLKAWNCDQQAFSPTMIGLSGWQHQDSYPKAGQLMSQDRSLEKLTIARLDVPHGLAVKIAASVNVVVFYSPSVSKVWTMAAKYCGVKESGQDMASPARVFGPSGISERAGEPAGRGGSGCKSQSWGSTGLKDGFREGRENGQPRLCLIKCAVVDCNGPVYALHLSLQHLFVGQVGGLRVWPLRPLIKNIRLPKRKETTEEKGDLSDASKEDSTVKLHAAISATDSGNSGQFIFKMLDKDSAFDGHGKSGPPAINTVISCENAQENNIRARSASMAMLENGLVEGLCEVEKMGDAWKTKVGLGRSSSSCGNKSCTCNRGWVCMKQEDELAEGGLLKENSQEVFIEKEFGRSVYAEIHEPAALASRANGSKVHSELINNYKNSEQQSGLEYAWKVAGPQGRNGLLFHEVYSMEDWHSQRQLSQSSTLSSSSSLSQSPVSSSHSAVAAAASSMLPASSLPSRCCCFTSAAALAAVSSFYPSCPSACLGGCSLPGVKTSDNLHSPWGHLKTVSKDREGFISILVPFPRGNEQDDAWQLQPVRTKSQQAVGIHTLSEREFLVLDSLGKLHLLTLEHSIAAGDQKVFRGGGGSGDVSMKSLNCSMRVKTLAVLPSSLQNIGASAFSASYKLWISDGGYSIHVVALPYAHVPQEGDSVEEPRNLTVTQMVFTSERVCALAASSVDTMVALTQGSIVAYTVAGT